MVSGVPAVLTDFSVVPAVAPPAGHSVTSDAAGSGASLDVQAALDALRSGGWDLSAELTPPLATVPHVPRSLVHPLAAALRSLARMTVRRGAVIKSFQRNACSLFWLCRGLFCIVSLAILLTLMTPRWRALST